MSEILGKFEFFYSDELVTETQCMRTWFRIFFGRNMAMGRSLTLLMIVSAVAALYNSKGSSYNSLLDWSVVGISSGEIAGRCC